MSALKLIPWRFFATRMARAYGFLDPIQFLSRLRGFSKPSEVSEPVELLRAGVLFHARGLINTKAIQNNLDWVWPYWVERQFNPADRSFIPRAFSFSHINLTHRNWTAVGLPDVAYYPIVDPRGLVTPLFDGWSLDFWLIGTDETYLLPSKLDQAEQTLEIGESLLVRSRFREKERELSTTVELKLVDQHPQCVIRVAVRGPSGTRLAVTLRPYNPEGISFIDSIALGQDRLSWLVNDLAQIFFDRAPEKCILSCYKEGDVLHSLPDGPETTFIKCSVSMASAAAVFPITEETPLEVRVPIIDELKSRSQPRYTHVPSWRQEIARCSRFVVPDHKWQKLYEQAVATLILHSPEEVYPGPYTYKRFWYRDAAFILNTMISLGARERSLRALKLFPLRQTRAGYFRSQEGEWDSNGEAIWIMHRYLKLTGDTLPGDWVAPIEKGARWIMAKRLPRNLPEVHAGLLPAGFSAEHLGPNDYYYWDNFWGVAGLRCAAELLRDSNPAAAEEFSAAANEYLQTITASFKHIPDRQARGAISASPHRRLDAGAVGSLVADFPLQLFPAGEVRLMKTVDYLINHSFYGGGFFQNMIHSGINAYLTLHVAQVLLRAGDARAFELIETVANLASPTGQWPEAIHPQTGGGCMGDGQHVWAAAEWAMMMRNLFVREESDRLVIGAGILPKWLETDQDLAFEGTLTAFGRVTVRLKPERQRKFSLLIEGEWARGIPRLDIQVPGYVVANRRGSTTFSLEPQL
jgi:hypothetical protein